MAKKSVEARQRKREKLVAQYAERRKTLKEAGDYAALDKLPKNSSKYACAIAASSLAVRVDMYVCLVSAVSSSATWLAMAKYLV